MSEMDLKCSWCNKPFSLRRGEYNRQVKNGRKKFFCCLACGTSSNNSLRPTRRVLVMKVCPVCNVEFEELTGSKSSTFCSGSCASKGSVTDYRREKARETGKKNFFSNGLNNDLETIALSLRSRESWKYRLIKEFLDSLCEEYEFESIIGRHIHDLVFKGRRVIVEFDGIEHGCLGGVKADSLRDEESVRLGWTVRRIKVASNTVIDPAVIRQVLNISGV